MNLTGGNTLPNVDKRANWHLISLAVGLAAAISIVGALSLTEDDTTEAPTTAIRDVAVPPAISKLSQSTIRPQVIIVESQAQADQLAVLMAEEQRTAEGAGYGSPLPSFLIIASPDEQYRYHHVIADQMEFGTFDIIDLRGYSESAASPASSDATEASAEPDHVLFIVESAEQQATISAALEADRMAAILAGDDVPFQPTSFFVVSSLQEERALTELQLERLLLPYPTSDIIDLRN